MSLTVTDLFCGAGGSAQGAHAVPGVELRIAANHWQLAVDSHAENFPEADHDVADISQVDPRRYPATDLLWASPECTNHSQAKGLKRAAQSQPDLFGETLPTEAAERSRATMWDVPRFAEAMLTRGHPYQAIIVENVVDAAKWIMWPAWLQAMDCLGYAHQVVYLNSMHAPAMAAPRAPQSRDRLYVVFARRNARQPDVTPRPLAWCEDCAETVAAIQSWKNPARRWGRYRQQYVYRCPNTACRHSVVEPYALAAATAINWAQLGQRIGDRDKPLSAKTLARIQAGLLKYGTAPFATIHRGAPGDVRTTDVHRDVLPTVVASGNHHGLVVPVEGRDGKAPQPTSEPIRTMTTRAETALVVPYYSNGHARPACEPLATVTTVDRAALVIPTGGTWNTDPYPVSDPFHTRTTVESEGIAFIAELRGGGSTYRDVREPLATVTASGNHHMLVRHNGDGGAEPGWQCTPVSEPMRTLTTGGHQSLVGWDTTAPRVEDCTFRMLEPSEIQKAMAFAEDYRVLGNRRERVRQLGNAVTPPAAEFLVSAVVASLDVS